MSSESELEDVNGQKVQDESSDFEIITDDEGDSQTDESSSSSSEQLNVAILQSCEFDDPEIIMKCSR